MTTYVARVNTGRGRQQYTIAGGNGVAGVDVDHNVDGPSTWTASRFYAAWRWLMRWPSSESDGLVTGQAGPQTTNTEALNVALISVALWALDTGYGRSEWNNNPSNIHCAANAERCVRFADSPEVLESFETLPAFMRRFYEMIARTPMYAAAWRDMKAGKADAMLRLYEAGFACAGLTPAEATSLVTRCRAYIVSESDADADRYGDADVFLPAESRYRATLGAVPNRCGGNTPDDSEDTGDLDGPDGEIVQGDQSGSSGFSWPLLGAFAFGVWWINKDKAGK